MRNQKYVNLINSGALSLGLHYSSTQWGDKTLVITAPTENLADEGFNNIISRYKIDGNADWEFYGEPNFKDLLFTATGPIGWTQVEFQYNDAVSSVKPIESE